MAKTKRGQSVTLKLPPPPSEEELKAQQEERKRQAQAHARAQADARFRGEVAVVASSVAAGLLASPSVDATEGSDEDYDRVAKVSVAIARRIVIRANVQPFPAEEDFLALEAEFAPPAEELVGAEAAPFTTEA